MRAPRLCTMLLLTVAASPALAGNDDAFWRPSASERLMRLPAGYIERAVDRDFRESTLAAALAEAGQELAVRMEGLGDLQAAAAAAAGGPERDALRQQVLEEKQAYLQLMGRRHDLERQRLRTQLTLYEGLLGRLQREAVGAADGSAQRLVADREAAQRRLESSIAKVDMTLFADGVAAESRYGTEYRRHAQAVEQLISAINAHPMNRGAEIDGRGVDRQTFLRHLAAQSEAELALLDQQDLVLAYMAKLVALDAMAMADEVDARADESGPAAGPRDVSALVGLFVRPD